MQFLQIGIYALFSAAGIALIKLGSAAPLTVSFAGKGFAFQIGLITASGFACYIISFFLYMGLISKHSLNYIVPTSTGAVYVLVFLSSMLLFKEELSATVVLGNILVFAGIILVNIKST